MTAEDEVVLLRDALKPVMEHDLRQYGLMRVKPEIVKDVRETRYRVEKIDAKKLTDQVADDPRVTSPSVDWRMMDWLGLSLSADALRENLRTVRCRTSDPGEKKTLTAMIRKIESFEKYCAAALNRMDANEKYCAAALNRMEVGHES